MLFNAIKGGDAQSDSARDRLDDDISAAANNINSLDQPMTPCPSAVEYVTPVFAKNYQGVWRYVVQIPYEGNFTQWRSSSVFKFGCCFLAPLEL